MALRIPKNRFAKTRSDHQTERAEDYVEAIATLSAGGTPCRVTPLAKELGVSHVTVIQALDRLSEDGLVSRSERGPIRLTREGSLMAERSRDRHECVLKFLLALGVPEVDAQRDAEGIEHHVGDATLAQMRRWIDRSATAPSTARTTHAAAIPKRKPSDSLRNR
ncbi:MAG: GntR family transcriptional regulator [Planctomycetota bacterium]|nr:GntR family transcriptional regulator [Planctomycetota bacterium]